MPKGTKGYSPLQPEGTDSIEDEQDLSSLPQRLWPNPVYHMNLILFIALFLSVATNFVLGLLQWPTYHPDTLHDHTSPYGML